MHTKQAIQGLERELIRLNSTPMGRRIFMASIPFLLHSCASKSKHRHREGDNTGQATSISVADEKQMTNEVMPKMRKEYPPLKDKNVQRYIANLGNRIVHANKLHNKPYQYNFTVVDVKNVNAFALPAGTVFVTAPLIKMADSEAELAGVVGHEIGHIQARHTAERIDHAKKVQKKSWLYGLAGGLVGGAVGFGLGKLLCRKQDRECLQRASLYGAAAGAGGGLLIQKFAFMANSREDEMEADRIGFRTSYRAGFHKDHVGLFYSKLLKMEEKYKKKQSALLAPMVDAMSTHPPSKERVVQMNEMSRSVPLAGANTVSSREFDRVKKIIERYHS